MSWLQKLLPPKIQRSTGARKTVPEGLWTKCAACDAVLYSTDLEKNQNVCPKCGHHERFGARPRLDDRRDVELQPGQVQLAAAPGDLPLHRRAEIIDVEFRDLLGIFLGLDMDVTDVHRHARLLR